MRRDVRQNLLAVLLLLDGESPDAAAHPHQSRVRVVVQRSGCGGELVGQVLESGRVGLVHLRLQVVDVRRLLRDRRPEALEDILLVLLGRRVRRRVRRLPQLQLSKGLHGAPQLVLHLIVGPVRLLALRALRAALRRVREQVAIVVDRRGVRLAGRALRHQLGAPPGGIPLRDSHGNAHQRQRCAQPRLHHPPSPLMVLDGWPCVNGAVLAITTMAERRH
mmetsp:Transcript_6983/g.16851  ORF Transcript_6983/g.16851 Transcript_6983/m.16851 type:complete len:220 (-) Transcript_6983:77-736(-)